MSESERAEQAQDLLRTVTTHPKVVAADDPILRRIASPIEQGLVVGALLDAMHTAMDYPAGIGLAAPQIGISVRAVVAGIPHGSEMIKHELLNPEIYEHNGRPKLGWEGCLSFPRGWRALVPRSPHIKVRGFDRHWRPVDFGARDLVARVLQHEIDHLDGILVSDKAERIDKRKAQEQL